MCKKLFYLTLFAMVLWLGVAPSHVYGQAGLIGYWKFDEASGTMASDSSGGGNNGTLANGAILQPGVGMSGGALFVDPADASGYCEISTGGMKVSEGTLMIWGKLADPQPARNTFFMGHSTQPAWANRIQLHTDSADNLLDLGLGGSHNTRTGIVDLALETWYHIALTWNAGNYVVYVNGAEMAAGTYGGLTLLYPIMDIGNDGHDQRTRTEAFGGLLDEMKIFDRPLTAAEVQQAMRVIPPGTASKPSPPDKAIDVSRDVILNWTPGALATTHDVYLGRVFDDVKSADITTPLDVLVSPGQDANTFDPEGLFELGQTYYWRVDEVNDLEPDSPWKGAVWSFTVEPVAYLIAGDSITATASSSNSAEEGPENTINGSGLNADDLHSVDSTSMWLSSAVDPNAAWIQYEFDRVYKLYQMVAWNHNASTEPLVGLGFREVTIEYSTDGAGWIPLGTTHEFARGSGVTGYAANTTIDLGGAAAKYIRITARSNWGGLLPQFGLSEVRFFSVPVIAREPSPEPGATGVDANGTLRWRAGREAVTHNIYLSTDQQAVIDGTAPVVTVTSPGYTDSLDLASTYYWRIDEVNEAEVPSSWQGDLWDFTTQEYIVVDDFESYNDIPAGEEGSNPVYVVWTDGFDSPSVNGSTMGYTEAFQPSTESSVVYDGQQSVPLFYDNTVAAYSEVTANVADLQAGQDWTRHGIKALTLRFYGDPNNAAQQMYVKVNDFKVTYDGDAENLARVGWQMWSIDLASFGVDLSNVTELSIGVERIGGIGGQGMILLDGIRLYAYDRQIITPAEPAPTGL